MAIQQPPQQSGRPEVPQGSAVHSRFSGLAVVNGMKHLTELRLVPKNSPPAVQLHEHATTRSVVVNHRLMAFWHTMIGKKIVMAITSVVLVGFVIAHMLGNLKIFAGPDEINAYSRFLREVG